MDDDGTTRLLVWDEPDMLAALGSVLVTEPETPADIDLGAVYLWLAARCDDGQGPEAQLFASVAPGTEASVAQHITDVRTNGFGVVARPVRAGSGPLTPTLVAHLRRAVERGGLAEVLVASHDRDGLGSTLDDLAGSGVAVTVVGFRERAGFAADSERIGFFDLEDVAGAFAFPLPRTNLYDLPEEGLALPPLGRPSRPASSLSMRPASGAGGSGGGLGADSSGTSGSPGGSGGGGNTSGGSGIAGGSGGLGRTARMTRPAWATRPAYSEQDSSADVYAPPPPPSSAPGVAPGLDSGDPSDPAAGETIQTPASGPSTAGALDDLLAGVQATPLASTPPPSGADDPPSATGAQPSASPSGRPGRVFPPNGEVDQT